MRARDGYQAAPLLPAKRWRRRLTSLRAVYPEPAPVVIAEIDPTLLTPDEWWELGRIMEIVERKGLAACSEDELDVLICLQLKLEERSTECCLCHDDR